VVRFRVLACDYDRTLATDAIASNAALAAIRAVRASGRRLVLVTGRTLAELLDVFTELTAFDLVVVENGAVIVVPESGEQQPLAEPIPARLLRELRDRGVANLVVGSVICATSATRFALVHDVVEELGLGELELIINRDSLMVTPPGVNKGSGLRAAVTEFGESLAATVAVGDGENDLPLVGEAGAGVAVANAVDQLKALADIVLDEPNGAGIVKLCASLVDDDLAGLLPPRVEQRAG
jgi:hydroxymethylpyrimidine pyrophosphatase-like HAD family hydrolase